MIYLSRYEQMNVRFCELLGGAGAYSLSTGIVPLLMALSR